jgi:hypothetical protein
MTMGGNGWADVAQTGNSRKTADGSEPNCPSVSSDKYKPVFTNVLHRMALLDEVVRWTVPAR